MSGTAVLLLGHGAVERVEDVPAYLRRVLGREVPPRVLEEVGERYRRIGGSSPFASVARLQAAALQHALESAGGGETFTVRCGYRNWDPSIAAALGELLSSKPERVAALCLTPFYSGWSVGGYFSALDAALAEVKSPPPVLKIDSWHQEPHLLDAYAQFLRQARTGAADGAEVLFTAHSLPLRLLAGDPYPEQVEKTAKAVAQRAGAARWCLGWQSAGMTQEPWLGPSAEQRLEAMARHGCSEVVLDPIGFLSDHLETLYDDDILLREHAQKLGMRFRRVPALNAAPGLIAAMASAVRGRLAGALR